MRWLGNLVLCAAISRKAGKAVARETVRLSVDAGGLPPITPTTPTQRTERSSSGQVELPPIARHMPLQRAHSIGSANAAPRGHRTRFQRTGALNRHVPPVYGRYGADARQSVEPPLDLGPARQPRAHRSLSLGTQPVSPLRTRGGHDGPQATRRPVLEAREDGECFEWRASNAPAMLDPWTRESGRNSSYERLAPAEYRGTYQCVPCEGPPDCPACARTCGASVVHIMADHYGQALHEHVHGVERGHRGRMKRDSSQSGATPFVPRTGRVCKFPHG